MVRVKNTKHRLILAREADMNKDKKGVINAKFTWIGRDYGVLVVDTYYELSHEGQN